MGIFQRHSAAVGGVRNTRGAAATTDNNNTRQGARVAATGGEGSSAEGAGEAAAAVAAEAGAAGAGAGAGGAGATARAVGAETGSGATAAAAAAAAAARDASISDSTAVPQQLPPPPRPPSPSAPARVGIRGASARRMTTNTRMYPVGPRPQGNDFLLFSLGFAAVVSYDVIFTSFFLGNGQKRYTGVRKKYLVKSTNMYVGYWLSLIHI